MSYMQTGFKRTQAKTRIEVVLKITERCNINCSYCYMFNGGNDDYLKHPIYISEDVILATAKFLAQGARDLGTKKIRIIYHGGEPMMFKKKKFAAMCDVFIREITPYAKVEFGMQTNGMLVNDEWLEILAKYKIGVGVSIDGPAEYHDIERVDHQNNGTYQRVAAGLRKIQEGHKAGTNNYPGTLSVINTNHDPVKIYRHLTGDLQIRKQNYLIPMETHDTIDPASVERLGNYLCAIFDEWVADNNPKIEIRIIKQAIWFFLNGKDVVKATDAFRKEEFALIAIASNGEISPCDELKITNILPDEMNVLANSLIEVLNSPTTIFLDEAEHTLPNACKECCWQNYCLGGSQNGSLVNRFSKKNGFDNPSVYCSALKKFYGHVVAYLLRNGASVSNISQVLEYTDSPYRNEFPARPLSSRNRVIPIRATS